MIGLQQGKKKSGIKYTVRTNRNKIFYPKEWKKFFDCLKESQKFTFLMLINTGARINECINVKVEDLYELKYKRMIFKVTKVKAKHGEKNPIPRNIKLSTQFTKN